MPSLPGPFELLIILVVVLLLLGPKRLPEMGSALGKTIREFRKATTDVQESLTLDPTTPTPANPAPAAPAPSATADAGEDRAAS